jgi:aldehyde dehydrogenase (NAD+)
MTNQELLDSLDILTANSGAFAGGWLPGAGEPVPSMNPSNDSTIATASMASMSEYEVIVQSSQETFAKWRRLPAPARGEYVRLIGEALRENKSALGALVAMEAGKIRAEGEGEVQEMIDVADFAVGLSRQLYGLTMPSERPGHRLYEQWHPLGPVGIITAFNFPVAVWAWNALIAAVCGDTVIWKPSPLAPLTAIAITKIVNTVMEDSGFEAVFNLALGGAEGVGEALVNDSRIPLISATGSCDMGRTVGTAVAARMGRSLLELGGNNAIIVMDDADIELCVRGALFSAVGTAGQRCTTLRRLIVQSGIRDRLAERLVTAYQTVPIGDPLAEGTLMGPLISRQAVLNYQAAIETAVSQGGTILTGNEVLGGPGNFVKPTIISIPSDADILQTETFAPILYLMEFDDLEEAIAIQNGVNQGLSSAIFTDSLSNAEHFLASTGSDCGIANVNIGTSGAEIGGAFGGEKDTGGGRESGSDSWKAYMRRQTVTINWSGDLPLAQGIEFDTT